MASINATADAAAVQTPPVVADLTTVFAALEDGELLAALAGPRRRGPKGHPLRVLWQCFVAKHRLGLSSTDAMIRALHDKYHDRGLEILSELRFVRARPVVISDRRPTGSEADGELFVPLSAGLAE